MPPYKRAKSSLAGVSFPQGVALVIPSGAWVGRIRQLSRKVGETGEVSSVQLAVLCIVTIGALIERLWRLGEIPDSLNTDELVAIHTASLILRGHGPGMLALDANGQLALGAYVQALSLHLFGDSVWALRLPAALLSALAIPLFYLLARRLLRPWSAMGATVLFASQVYAVSLARSGWLNDFAYPAELVAMWALLVGLQRGKLALISVSGIACALAGYGYAPFRLLVVGCLPLIVLSATAVPHGRWRPALAWIGPYLLASVPLAASLALQHDEVHRYMMVHAVNSQLQEYPISTSWLQIAASQIWKVVVGLVLLIPSPVAGLDLQHVPQGTWLLDWPSTLFYWLGLWSLAGRKGASSEQLRAGVRLWWWLLVVPVLLAEVPTRDVPALHPAAAAFPLYLVVSGYGLGYVSYWLKSYRPILATVVLWSAVHGAWAYGGWVDTDASRSVRHAGGQVCFPTPHLLTRPCLPVPPAP